MRPALHMFQEVESTNDLALAAADSAIHGETWVADQQTAGRGRREPGGARRTWHSPPGVNLYMSTLLRSKLPPEEIAKITVAVGFSVAQKLRETTGVDLWLKWPNDIYVGDRKLAGILTEGVFEGGSFAAAVVGIGLNINLPAAEIPAELAEIMTTLQIEAQRPFDRMSLAFEVQDAIIEGARRLEDRGLASFQAIAGEVDRCADRRVEVRVDGDLREGTAVGIDLGSGGLVVDFDGRRSVVTTGEAKLLS